MVFFNAFSYHFLITHRQARGETMSNYTRTLIDMRRHAVNKFRVAAVLILAVSPATLLFSQNGAADLIVYRDELQPPWVNSSWGATITFNSSDQASEGSNSIKVSVSAWGA